VLDERARHFVPRHALVPTGRIASHSQAARSPDRRLIEPATTRLVDLTAPVLAEGEWKPARPAAYSYRPVLATRTTSAREVTPSAA